MACGNTGQKDGSPHLLVLDGVFRALIALECTISWMLNSCWVTNLRRMKWDRSGKHERNKQPMAKKSYFMNAHLVWEISAMKERIFRLQPKSYTIIITAMSRQATTPVLCPHATISFKPIKFLYVWGALRIRMGKLEDIIAIVEI